MKKKIIKNIILFAIIIIFIINLIQKFLNINAYSKIKLIISYIRMKRNLREM